MSRPIRKPLPSSRSDAAAPPSSPASQARQALDSGRYREAVELFKELLKQERRSEWVDGLAASYAGRASELAGKGMLQEALVVWRNRSSLCDKPLVEGPYLDWLLRNGDHHAALRLLTTPDVQATELETRLAAVALTAPDSALAQLPDDTALRRHRSAALAAVAACCRGDAVDLDAQLRAIPFRSPYRDLRFVLKALLLVGDDAAQAAEMIVRVAVDGPFEKLAAVVRTALLPGSRWLAAMLDLEDDGRQLLLDLKGCPENRRSLLLDVAQLARLGVPPAPSRVFDLLLRRYRGLPATAASLCRRLLPHADKRTAEYEKAFAPLGDAEGSCVMALAAEAQGSVERSEAFWLRAVRLLSSEGKSLPAALILRHLFDLVVGDADPSDFSSECTTWLARSLELDPDDRATHLQLIRIHRQAKDLRAARAAVEVAIARFANDPAVLLEAVETALAGNAFKKAVTLAKRLLELDPINSKVRALIGQAHLSHARRQIRSGRPDAAGKEIDLAEQWLGSANERSIAKLLRGLSATDERATQLLREGVAELGGKLLAALHVLLESVSLGGQALERGGDAFGFTEEVGDAVDGGAALDRRGGVPGRRREGRIDLVQAAEEGTGARRIAEQGLGAVIGVGLDPGGGGVGLGVQRGALKEGVGGPADAGDVHANAHAGRDQRGLVDHLADVAGGVDVGDVVRDRPQTGLGGHQPAGRRRHDRGEAHAFFARFPAKPDALSGVFCRANATALARVKANLLKFIAFTFPPSNGSR